MLEEVGVDPPPLLLADAVHALGDAHRPHCKRLSRRWAGPNPDTIV
jgi:hypothetical protein